MVSGTRDNPQNAVPVDRVKVDSAYLYYIIKCANIPFSLSSLRYSIKMGFVELLFTSLIRISVLNPKPKHLGVVLVGQAKAFL